MMIQVIEDSIANVTADALLTTVRPNTVPFGRVDRVIGRCAKQQFHRQVRTKLLMEPGAKVVHARKHQHHLGKFKDVIFVIDDGKEELDDVLARGLDAASAAKCRTISLPALRMREGSRDALKDQKISRMILALRLHEIVSSKPVELANIVIYNDTQLAKDFRLGIEHASSSL